MSVFYRPFDPEKPIEVRCKKPNTMATNYGELFTEVWRSMELVKLLVKRDAALIWDADDKDYPGRLIEVAFKDIRNVKES